MRTIFAVIVMLLLLATLGSAQPVVTQVSNAASEALPPLQNAAIAQGSYFAIYGTGLGASPASTWNLGSVTANGSYQHALPTTLGGTSVTVTVNGAATQAYVEYASPTQVNAVLPSPTPVGSATLTVSYSNATSAAFKFTVAASSFGTFTWTGAGSGPGIMTNAQTYALLTPFTPIKNGAYVTIWGTGLGQAPNVETEGTAPPSQTNLCPNSADCPVTVWVAGQKATVLYAGRSGYTAEDQIDFQVPAGVQGCYVEVAVQTGAVISNFTSMAVDPNGNVCQDDDGVDYSTVATAIAQKGKAGAASIALSSTFLTIPNVPLVGTILWDEDEVTGEVATFPTVGFDALEAPTQVPSVGNCGVYPFQGVPPPTDPALAYGSPLDAGAGWTIMGPNGNKNVGKVTGGYAGVVGGVAFSNLLALEESGMPEPAPYFLNTTGWNTAAWQYGITQGMYTLTGPGGADVGPFSVSGSINSGTAMFQWTNQGTITASAIPRDAPLTITWTGGPGKGFVVISAIASTLASGTTPGPNTPGILAVCVAPTSAGSFTVPVEVLESLPSTASSTAFVSPGELLVGTMGMPLEISPTPSGLDVAYVYYRFLAGQTVTWK